MRFKLVLIIFGLLGLASSASAQNPCDFPYPDSCQFPDTCCAIAPEDCPWDVDDIDVLYLISWMRGGAPPLFFSMYDVNCNCRINGADIVYMVHYLSGRGAPPICCFYQCREHLRTALLGNRVWNDADSDGVQDSGESGLPGVTVNLYDCENPPEIFDSAITAPDGFFLFDSLAAWNYRLRFSLPSGFQFSPANQGGNDSLDSDVFPSSGFTNCITVSEGEIDLTWDAGMYLTEEPPDSGCTRSKGYWKNHAGFGPQEDLVTQYLPIWLGDPGDTTESILVNTAQIAYDILAQNVYGEPSNGITKLYAQLLAAKLNIAAGANDDDVEDVIENADEFLAGHSWEDWGGLTREQRNFVSDWKNTLELYNEGEIGPGRCEDGETILK